jgi:hypothetical protein
MLASRNEDMWIKMSRIPFLQYLHTFQPHGNPGLQLLIICIMSTSNNPCKYMGSLMISAVWSRFLHVVESSILDIEANCNHSMHPTLLLPSLINSMVYDRVPFLPGGGRGLGPATRSNYHGFLSIYGFTNASTS